MAQMHTYQLSTIDQSVTKTYLRYCLCYPCEDSEQVALTKKLQAAAKRAVTHLPILTGTVHSTADDGRRGGLGVSTSLNRINTFEPMIKNLHLDAHTPTYQHLCAAAMPPKAFLKSHFAPISDTPCENGPAFAIQATFIRGGLIVALCLHHSVADVSSMSIIIREMSSDLPSCKLTNDDLRRDVLEQTRLRDCLSGSRGAKATGPEVFGTGLESKVSVLETSHHNAERQSYSCVVGFDLALIEGTGSLVNERFHYYHGGSPVHLTGFDIVAAICWRGIIRASRMTEEQQASLTMHVNIRNRVVPPLDDDFFGNASVPVDVYQATSRLTMPFELTSIQHTAWLIRTARATVTEPYVRLAIAAMNARDNEGENAVQFRHTDTSHGTTSPLVVESEDHLPATTVDERVAEGLGLTSWDALDEAHLSLGLGEPAWVRKLVSGQSSLHCTVLPVKREQGLWEVDLELTEDVMQRLLEDEGFMKFVDWVA